MEELEQILLAHVRRYPLMEPTDAVKLIYQNEFGGGHLIRNPEAALAYLRREYAETPRQEDAPPEEDIGNGILRISLSALPAEKLEALGQCFLRSARSCQGSQERFQEKLAFLRAMTFLGTMPFDPLTLDAYLRAYRDAGYPAVSHSSTYRENYHPAYRIVLKDFWGNP